MIMQRTQKKIADMPDTDEIMQALQREYDLLMTKMSEYYAAKKRFVEYKQASIKKSYDNLELAQKYQELKHSMLLQKQRWLEFNQLQLSTAQ